MCLREGHLTRGFLPLWKKSQASPLPNLNYITSWIAPASGVSVIWLFLFFFLVIYPEKKLFSRSKMSSEMAFTPNSHRLWSGLGIATSLFLILAFPVCPVCLCLLSFSLTCPSPGFFVSFDHRLFSWFQAWLRWREQLLLVQRETQKVVSAVKHHQHWQKWRPLKVWLEYLQVRRVKRQRNGGQDILGSEGRVTATLLLPVVLMGWGEREPYHATNFGKRRLRRKMHHPQFTFIAFWPFLLCIYFIQQGFSYTINTVTVTINMIYIILYLAFFIEPTLLFKCSDKLFFNDYLP